MVFPHFDQLVVCDGNFMDHVSEQLIDKRYGTDFFSEIFLNFFVFFLIHFVLRDLLSQVSLRILAFYTLSTENSILYKVY